MDFSRITKLDLLKRNYETHYVGNGRYIFPNKFFEGCEPSFIEQTTLDLVKFVIETYLGWTPNQTGRTLTFSTLKKLKLAPSIFTFIKIPKEYNSESVIVDYLLSRMYPKQNNISVYEESITTYERVLSGEISRFPASWMATIEGMKRFSIILDYALSSLPPFYDKADLYNFIFSPLGTRFLQEAHLYYYGSKLFPSSVEIYHYGMPKALRSDFYFQFHLWRRHNKVEYDNPYTSEGRAETRVGKYLESMKAEIDKKKKKRREKATSKGTQTESKVQAGKVTEETP